MAEVICEEVQSPPRPFFAFIANMRLEDIKPRLRAVRASVSELAEFMGVEYHVADRIVNVRRKHLTTQEADAIRRFFELREKPVYDLQSAGNERGGLADHAAGRAEVPLFGGADTPDGWVISLSASGQVGRVMAHPSQASAKRAFAVEVVDETMSPRFESGELAYVAGGTMPRRGQDCLVEFPNLTARILQFMERTERQVVFRQLNPPRQVVLKAGDGFSVHAIVGRG